MTRFFERVTYDAISDSNRDFAVSVNAMTETLNSSMVNFERQLFYSNTVSTLFRKDGFTDAEKSYIMRDLNSSLNAADFTEAIYVYNGYTDTVYSTGPFFARKLEDVNAIPVRELSLTVLLTSVFVPYTAMRMVMKNTATTIITHSSSMSCTRPHAKAQCPGGYHPR